MVRPAGGQRKKKNKMEKRERERERKKTRPMEWSRKMVGFVQRKQRISEYKTERRPNQARSNPHPLLVSHCFASLSFFLHRVCNGGSYGGSASLHAAVSTGFSGSFVSFLCLLLLLLLLHPIVNCRCPFGYFTSFLCPSIIIASISLFKAFKVNRWWK